MSVDKFKFVSPGVFIDEIDQSALPRASQPMGPVIIGRSLRGPLMRPVRVGSFAEFVEIFGEPVAGGVGGDVWRDGNKTSPTYGAYAAQAYLRNNSPVTFVRLGGKDTETGITTDSYKPGWKTSKAYGLFVAPLSGAAGSYKVEGTGTLASIIYATTETSPAITGYELTGSDVSATGAGKWLRPTGPNLELKLSISGSDSAIINLDENSKKYIRNVLNTNPILTNSSILSTDTKKNYFLGETYKTVLENKNISLGSENCAAVLVELASGSYKFSDFSYESKPAESGWVVSQHKGETGSFSPNSIGEYPVQKLFKLWGLTEGEWNSKNLKVSIEDIKESTNKYNLFGTFTVSVRKMDDTDANPIYLERFTGCTLDKSSENFISKKIGNKYSVWDYTNKSYIEYGTYDNKSKFIRVEVDAEVENGQTSPDLLPYGYYGPKTLPSVSYNKVTAGSQSVNSYFINSSLSASGPVNVVLDLPKLLTYSSTSESIVPSVGSMYWGIKNNLGTTKRFNKDLFDLVRPVPASIKDNLVPSYFFSLDDVSASVNTDGNIENKEAKWKQGYRKDNLSVTSGIYATGSDGSSTILGKFNKFTLPLVGGFDGVNITEKDPFNKRVLASTTENYAYNSVKIAIESIADPEVVEGNLVAMPGIEEKSLTSLLVQKCEERGDMLAIIDLEGDYTPEEGKKSPSDSDSDRRPRVDKVVANLKDRALNSSYGCAFFPWVLARDILNNNTVWIPPSIAALGTFSSSQRNTELWFAPAGFNRGGLSNGAAGLPILQTSLRLSSKDRDKLYEANINPIATFPAEGIVVFGQKTLQVTPSALDRINVRRLMIYVKKEISRFATRVLFDPNTEVTWKRFTNLVDPFLSGIKSRYGLEDFKVILDSTTTTPDLVDRNIMYAKIFLKPTRAVEYIAIDFTITNSGAAFQD